MTVQVVELQRAGGKFYFIVPAEFEPMAMLHEELADEALRTNMICMCHDKAKADAIAAVLNATSDIWKAGAGGANLAQLTTLFAAAEAFENNSEPDTRSEFDRKVDKSTYVSKVSYIADKRVLEIIFRSNPGSLYSYEEFPPEKWAELQAAESVGSYISRVVVGPTGKNRPPVPPFKYTKRAVTNG